MYNATRYFQPAIDTVGRLSFASYREDAEEQGGTARAIT